MSSDALFGWDLTFKSVENDIKRKSDVFVAFIHWNLTKRGFRNIGIGDEKTVGGDEEKSELLPTGWNDKDNYSLRYILENKVFILHVINVEGTLIINFLRSEDLALTNLAVDEEETIKDVKGSIEKMIPNYKDLIYNLTRNLIDSVTGKPVCSIETQTSRGESGYRRPREDDDPLRVPARPGNLSDPPDTWDRIVLPPRIASIGRADLDPFAPGGSGGMLFNPFDNRRDVENPGLGIPGGLPRGAVPPGARFDPFGPPGGPFPGGRPGSRRPAPPDADHLPPPGFNDNMFL